MARCVSFVLMLLVYLIMAGFASGDGSDDDGESDREPKKDSDEDGHEKDCDDETTPFGGTGCKGGRSLEKVEKLIDTLDSLLSPIPSPVNPSTISSSTPSPASASLLTILLSDDLPSSSTTSPLSRNATLACQIYSTYTSFCSTGTVKYSMIQGTTTTAANESQLSASSDSLRASCLYYSSSSFVPQAFDIAASVCTNYTGSSAALQTAASSAASHARFCVSIGNVRCPLTATVG